MYRLVFQWLGAHRVSLSKVESHKLLPLPEWKPPSGLPSLLPRWLHPARHLGLVDLPALILKVLLSPFNSEDSEEPGPKMEQPRLFMRGIPTRVAHDSTRIRIRHDGCHCWQQRWRWEVPWNSEPAQGRPEGLRDQWLECRMATLIFESQIHTNISVSNADKRCSRDCPVCSRLVNN